MAKLWATRMPFISKKCTFACTVLIYECSDCPEYGLLESNNLNWVKNERAKHYAAKARRSFLWPEPLRKALSLQRSIYLFGAEIKELLIEFTIYKSLAI